MKTISTLSFTLLAGVLITTGIQDQQEPTLADQQVLKNPNPAKEETTNTKEACGCCDVRQACGCCAVAMWPQDTGSECTATYSSDDNRWIIDDDCTGTCFCHLPITATTPSAGAATFPCVPSIVTGVPAREDEIYIELRDTLASDPTKQIRRYYFRGFGLMGKTGTFEIKDNGTTVWILEVNWNSSTFVSTNPAIDAQTTNDKGKATIHRSGEFAGQPDTRQEILYLTQATAENPISFARWQVTVSYRP